MVTGVDSVQQNKLVLFIGQFGSIFTNQNQQMWYGKGSIAIGGISVTDLDPNIEYILGLTAKFN